MVKLQSIHQTLDVLKQLPRKQKEDFALREAVFEMHQQIEDVLKKGYSFEEVAEILSHNDIVIKGVTLKQYLTTFRRQKSRKRAESKRAKAVVEGESVSSEPEVATPKGKTVKSEKSKSASERKIGKFVEIPDDL